MKRWYAFSTCLLQFRQLRPRAGRPSALAEGNRRVLSGGAEVDEGELGGSRLHVLDLCFCVDASDDGSGDEDVHVVIVS